MTSYQQGGYGGDYGAGQGAYSNQSQGYPPQQGNYQQSNYQQEDRYGAGQGGVYGDAQSGGYGQQTTQNYGQQDYGASAAGPSILSNPDFLARVEGARKDIDSLSANISSIAQLHQRAIGSPDASGSAQLENLVSQTQILNTRIRDQVKYLETDAARSGGNKTKDAQVRNLKGQFKSRLEQYQQEEVQYKKRYQEQIARQYRIVNPQASEEEVREAMDADWGDEGVFQTAVSSLQQLLSAMTNMVAASIQSCGSGHICAGCRSCSS